MLTIAKREFRSYFDSPLAYVVICLSYFGLGLMFFNVGASFWRVDKDAYGMQPHTGLARTGS